MPRKGGGPSIIPRGGAVHQFILKTFAKTGRCPTLVDVQREFKLASVEEADALIAELERLGSVHRDPGDRKITHAYPFSNEPTPHRVQLADGPQVYAMCAIDALGIPFMLKQDVEISSSCAHCGGKIEIQIQSGRITQHSPQNIVVWYPNVHEGCVAATDLCPQVNFFCLSQHLKQWTVEHPKQTGRRLTLEQGLKGGCQAFETLLQGPDQRCP